MTPCRCGVTLQWSNHHRYAITETDDIKDALEVARRRWPQLAHKPNALIRQLIFAGQRAVEGDRAAFDRAREKAIEATKGGLAGVYGSGYLEELRSDWPGDEAGRSRPEEEAGDRA